MSGQDASVALDQKTIERILWITRILLSRNYDFLVRENLIYEHSIEFISSAVEIVQWERYLLPRSSRYANLSIVPFDDGRGYAINIVVPVEKSNDDDLQEIIVSFELLNNGALSVASAFW